MSFSAWRALTECPGADALLLTPDLDISEEIWLRQLGKILESQCETSPDIVAALPASLVDNTELLLEGLRGLPGSPPDALLFSAGLPRVAAQRIEVLLAVVEMEKAIPAEPTALIAGFGMANPEPVARMPLPSRLVALLWDEDRFAADAGMRPPAPGAHSGSNRIAEHQRAAVRLAAARAGLAAVDWLPARLASQEMARACRQAAADGFSAIVTDDGLRLDLVGESFEEKY